MDIRTQPVDVQSEADHRRLAINEVGIRGLRYPVRLESQGAYSQDSIADFSMTVLLSADQKGTHMSRFVELLESYRGKAFNNKTLRSMFVYMLDLLDSKQGRIEASFNFFVEKTAPVSQVKSLMDYEGGFIIEKNDSGQDKILEKTWVKVPVTSLCPCSKAISEYGAHNQRSHLTLTTQCYSDKALSLLELIHIAETQASCELYGILKRPDEKFVTERAYENPKFVEDLVRDVAVQLREEPRVLHFEVIAENFESIHNHSAYAVLRG